MTGRGHNQFWNYERLCSRPPLKILVIKLRAIGDVLLSTVVIENLRTAFTNAQIDFLTEHPARDVIVGNPHLSNAIVFHTKKDSILTLFHKVYSEHYDLVFDLFCNPRSAQITFATRAEIRVGYPFRGRKYAYNVHVTPRSDTIHNTEFNLDPLAALSIPVTSRRIYFPLDEETVQFARDLLLPLRKNGKRIIALNPSGTWETKRWGLDHFAQLGDRLADECNALPLIIWGPGEEQDAAEIARSMQCEAYVIPKTTLKQLGAVLYMCDYTISNDSGPMHISAAVGTPTLGIFGPTNPYLQGPFNLKCGWVRLEGLECLACNLTSCNIENICMRDLPVRTVFDAFCALAATNDPAFNERS